VLKLIQVLCYVALSSSVLAGVDTSTLGIDTMTEDQAPEIFKVDSQTPQQKLLLSALNQGTKLYVTTPAGIPTEASRQIEVQYGKKTRIAGDLDQLAGFVHITSAAQALEFVRFRTSPATWLNWPRSRYRFVEVTDQEHPWRDDYGAKIDISTKSLIEDNRSGDFGILSPDAFRVGKFSHPTVHRKGKNYIIDRWVLQESTVYKIRETVGPLGEYTRRSTQQLSAPNIPGTQWRLPTYY